MNPKILLCAIFLTVARLACAQSEGQILDREFSFAGGTPPVVIVANISGSVRVKAHGNSTAMVRVQKIVKGNRGDEITIGNVQLGDTLILYTDGICATFGRSEKRHAKGLGGWGYDFDACNEKNSGWSEDNRFEYELNYDITVPSGSSVFLSTVNDGDIEVSGVKGKVVANNVNGGIFLKQLAGAVSAHTVNGDVELAYEKNPSEDSRCYTLNGDIRADFLPGLQADLSFKSFNGDLYTNVDDVREQAPQLEKVSEERGVKYKVDGSRYKIRNGGMLLDFETFNGNVYLNEKRN